MFSLFFAGIQQDFKLAIWPPILCALFRLAFILIYREKRLRSENGRNGSPAFAMDSGGGWTLMRMSI